MDARLTEIIARLDADVARLEEAMASMKEALISIAGVMRENDKALRERIDTVTATQLFLANQQPRWSGTAPWRARRPEGDGSD